MPWMTIPIALAITGGAAGAAQVYGTRTAGKQNRRAMEATERSDVRAESLERERLTEERRALDERLKLEREAEARKERFYTEAVQRDRERWQDYLRINEPHWRQGSGVLQNLYDIAGVGSAPGFQMPTQPAPGTTAPTTGYGPAGPVSSTTPVDRPPRRVMPMMPTPSPASPMSSLQDVMQLATLGGSSRMPVPARGMDLSRLMTAPSL